VNCPAPLIGEILLEAGLVTREDIAEALREQRTTGLLLGEILRRKGLVTSQQVWEAWLRQLARRYQQIGRLEAPLAVRRLAFGDLADHYHAVPLMLDHITVILIKAFSDMPIIEDLQILYGDQKIVVATTSPRLYEYLFRAYPRVISATCIRCNDPIFHAADRITIDNERVVFVCRACYRKLAQISGVFEEEQPEKVHKERGDVGS